MLTPESDTVAHANLIRRYRFQNGEMTQQQLDDLSGVSRQTVSALEQNKVSPSLEVAFSIARVFGAFIENLFLFEPDPESEDPYKDGLTIHVTFDDPPDRSTDSDVDGDGM